MKKRILLSAALAILSAEAFSIAQKKQSAPGGPKLELIKTLDGFMQPESALYDKIENVWYVSNVNWGHSPMGAINKDGNGSISKIGAGLVVTHNWVTGLNAPRGMAIYHDKLYVADLKEIVEINMASAKIVKKYHIDDAVFLNDLAVDAAGRIFASNTWGYKDFTGVFGSVNRTIYMLANGSVSVWLSSHDLNAPNGLLIQGDNMYVTTWGNGLSKLTYASDEPGKVLKINLVTKQIQTVVNAIGNVDGIVRYHSGFLITENLKGQMLYLDETTKKVTVIDSSLSFGAADFDINSDTNEIVLPINTKHGTKVKVYKIK